MKPDVNKNQLTENYQMPNIVIYFLFILFTSFMASAYGAHITFVSADSEAEKQLIKRIKHNADALLKAQLNGQGLSYRVVDAKTKSQLMTLQRQNTDVIVTTNFLASSQLAKLRNHAKPSIAGVILDERLQGMPKPLVGRSGIHNFTYLKSPLNVFSDLNKFYQIYPYKSLGVVLDASFYPQRQQIQQLFDRFSTKPFKLIFVSPDDVSQQLDSHLNGQNAIDALYVMPLFGFNQTQLDAFFQAVNQHKLPSFSLLGRRYTQAGALASQNNADYTEVHARRIALNIMKILNGKNASSLPVNLPRLEHDLQINMQTAKKIGISPSFKVLENATMMNQLEANPSAKPISIYDALDVALSKNLSLKKIRQDIELSNTDIREAKRAFLPSIELSYTGTQVDKDFRNVQGAGGTHKLKAEASQVLFSDEALQTLKARKLGAHAHIEALKREEFKVTYDVLAGFIQHFAAKRQALIRKTYTETTLKDLNIAKRKSAVGYTGNLDVYRLESELANNQAQQVKAEADFKQTTYVLKKLLALPMNADVSFTEIQSPISMLSISDKRLVNDLDNPAKVAKFTDYLMAVARRLRPAILQYDLNIEAQKRLAKAEKRKWYMPTVALIAKGTKEIARWDTVPERGKPTIQPNWDISLSASVPIFDRQHSTNQQKFAINIHKLELEKQDIILSINQALSNDMQVAMASYKQMLLYKKAVLSAKKNFDVIANYYQYGKVTISDYIDAKNNLLNSQLSVIGAESQFFVDYLKVEQQTGFYYFLADDYARDQFVHRFLHFLQEGHINAPDIPLTDNTSVKVKSISSKNKIDAKSSSQNSQGNVSKIKLSKSDASQINALKSSALKNNALKNQTHVFTLNKPLKPTLSGIANTQSHTDVTHEDSQLMQAKKALNRGCQ